MARWICPRVTLAAALAWPAVARAQPTPTPESSTGEEAGEATVRGRRPRRELTATPVAREEVQRIPGSFGDALRAIQNLPGIARAPFLSGSLMVRGSAPADTLVLVDGTFLPAAYHFGGLGSTVATEMLDRIDFFPGNFSARFGRATGGVVDLGLRQPMREGARTTMHLGVVDAGAFTEAALSPTVSVAASARFGWIGYLLSPIVAAVTGNAVFVGYWDYQAQADWRPTARDRLRFAAYGSGDSVGIQQRNGGGQGIGLGYHLVQASWWRHLDARTDLQVAVSTGWNGLSVEERPRANDPEPGDRVRLDSAPTHVRAELTHAFGARHRLYVGFDGLFGYRAYSSDVSARGRRGADSPRPRVTRETTTTLAQPGLYAELQLSPTPSLHLRPGARVDVYGATGTAIVSPRMTADLSAWRGGTLKFGVGYFTQPPLDERVSVAPELLFLAERVAQDGQGPRPERAVHVGVGVEQRISPWITVSVEGFYKSIRDAVVGFPSLDLLIAGERIDPLANVRYDGQGRVFGAEILLRHRQGERFFGWVAYTLMRAERRDGPGAPWRPFEFDQTHILTAVGSLRLGRGWELGARFRYVTGRPTAFTRSLTIGLTGATLPAGTEPWLDRVPDFHQLDLRLEKQWTHSWGRVVFYLEVLNVYNRINAEQVVWDADHAVSYPSGVFLPIVPNLGVRGEL
ncbi:MAG: TonB-dependent receptor [Polyangiales bacterium]